MIDVLKIIGWPFKIKMLKFPERSGVSLKSIMKEGCLEVLVLSIFTEGIYRFLLLNGIEQYEVIAGKWSWAKSNELIHILSACRTGARPTCYFIFQFCIDFLGTL